MEATLLEVQRTKRLGDRQVHDRVKRVRAAQIRGSQSEPKERRVRRATRENLRDCVFVNDRDRQLTHAQRRLTPQELCRLARSA